MTLKTFCAKAMFLAVAFMACLSSVYAGDRQKMSCLVRLAAARTVPHIRHGLIDNRPGLICAFVRVDPAAADSVFCANGCTVYDQIGRASCRERV